MLKLFGGADGGYTAFDVMVGDAKKIFGSRTMSTLAHTGILGFALNRTVRALHFKRICASGACFRPPLFALEKNGIIFGALGCHGNFSGLISRLLGAGCSFSREFLELSGSVGIYGFTPATMNIHKGKQSQC
jgi:hypothetical protein